jgi:D-glycero-D-manno-heptose 1,7-bisphosphate phosphatase
MSGVIPHKRLYIFNADGTLRLTTREGGRYPLRRGEWKLMPGAAETLARIPWSPEGPWLAIASDQNGVAPGEISEEDARLLICETIVAAVGRIPEKTAIALCIHGEGSRCICRTPQPGLLLALLDNFGIGAEDALYVGDLDSDAEAARRAGIDFIPARDFFPHTE